MSDIATKALARALMSKGPTIGPWVPGKREMDFAEFILAHDFTTAERAALAAVLLTPEVLAEARHVWTHKDAPGPLHTGSVAPCGCLSWALTVQDILAARLTAAGVTVAQPAPDLRAAARAVDHVFRDYECASFCNSTFTYDLQGRIVRHHQPECWVAKAQDALRAALEATA